MKTELYIIRHGETLWNLEKRIQGQLESDLSPLGQRQAASLAAVLRRHAFDAVYSSDLKRAHDTAAAVAKHSGQTVRIEKNLRERHFGVLQGLRQDEARQREPEALHGYKSDAAYQIPQGESGVAFSKRCIGCLEQLALRHIEQRVLVVTHGGVLKRLFKHTMSAPQDNYFPFKVVNTAINIFYFSREQGWFLERWGDKRHLNQALKTTD